MIVLSISKVFLIFSKNGQILCLKQDFYEIDLNYLIIFPKVMILKFETFAKYQ